MPSFCVRVDRGTGVVCPGQHHCVGFKSASSRRNEALVCGILGCYRYSETMEDEMGYSDEEIWGPIPGWPGYEVSTWLRVRSSKASDGEWRLLTVSKTGTVGLRSGARAQCRGVRSLMEEVHGLWRCACGNILPMSAKAKDGQYSRRRCPECARDVQIKLKYGLSRKQYDDMLWEQNGVCRVCNRPPAADKRLVVDHDHACCPTEKTCGNCVRSLLCTFCNRGIGLFDDDPTRLREAAAYIEHYL